jgi:hypothetical protein
MSLFKELKRRNVFRVGIAYTVASWLLIQVTDIIFPRIGLPDSAVMLVIALLAIGFIPKKGSGSSPKNESDVGWTFMSTVSDPNKEPVDINVHPTRTR